MALTRIPLPPLTKSGDITEDLAPAAAPTGCDISAEAIRCRRPLRPGALVGGLWRCARPRQWVKNVLVLAAPAAAGVLTDPARLIGALMAAAVLSMAASGAYFLNDALDVRADRAHPRKRYRPVAAGIVPVPVALIAAAALTTAALVLAVVALNAAVTTAVAVYCVLTAGYSWRLKRIPVLDIMVVACGFVLRAVTGALAVAVPVSPWFLLVAGFGSLFIAAGKRSAELRTLDGPAASAHRKVLGTYTAAFLARLHTLAATATTLAYCLWALGPNGASAAGTGSGSLWLQLSVLPFLAGLLRYSQHVDAGQAGAPEDLLLADRFLQTTVFIWVVLFTIGVYA